MNEFADTTLRDALLRGDDGLPAPDWKAVQRRAHLIGQSRRRRQLWAASVAVAVALLAAPALAGVGPLAGLIGSKPPPDILRQLAELTSQPYSPTGHVDIAKARLVFESHTPYGPMSITVAPSSNGTPCVGISTPARSKEHELETGCEAQWSVADPIAPVGDPLAGRVSAAVASLTLEYANGGTRPVPIQRGWYGAFVDPLRRDAGSDRAVALVARDRHGRELERLVLRQRPEVFESFAVRPERSLPLLERTLLTVRADDGTVAHLRVSPADDGGTCGHLVVAGVTREWTCTPSGGSRQWRAPFDWALHPITGPTPRAIFLDGIAFGGTSVELRFQDGTHRQVPLRHGRFLVALPHATWRPGHRLSAIVGRRNRRVVENVPMETAGVAFYGDIATPTSEERGSGGIIWKHPDVAITRRVSGGGTAGLRVWVPGATETLLYRGRARMSAGIHPFRTGGPAVQAQWFPIRSQTGRGDATFLAGRVRPVIRSLRVMTRSGRPMSVAITQHAYLIEFTPSLRARHPVALEAVDRRGRVVTRIRLPSAP